MEYRSGGIETKNKYFQYYEKYRYKKFLLSRNFIAFDFIKNIYKRNSLLY